jgi:type III pantothenate kinase
MTGPVHWLLIDAGNSALKWVLMSLDGRVGPAHGSRRNGQPTDTETALTADWRERVGVPVQAVYGCGVTAPVLMRAVERAARHAFSLPVHWFETQPLFEHDGVVLRNGYREPSQLGVDRWHALIAARAAFPDRALVVVAAGTATTVDGVTGQGDFIGGTIAPGVRLMLESLARGTANLPFASGRMAGFPLTTDDAIVSGVLGCQLGLVERFARLFRAQHGDPLVVLSGGHAAQLAPFVGPGTALPVVAREENLVLRGVFLRARALAAGAPDDGGPAP